MPSIISHAIGAVLINSSLFRRKFSKKLFFFIIVSAMIPDADAIGFHMGVPYESMFGHRGFTHSIFFSFVWSVIISILFFKNDSKQFYISILFLATVSHPLLDMMTNAGHGVALFAPFSNHRFISPWNPIKASPISISKFISLHGIEILGSEIKYIWIPSIVFFTLSKYTEWSER